MADPNTNFHNDDLFRGSFTDDALDEYLDTLDPPASNNFVDNTNLPTMDNMNQPFMDDNAMNNLTGNMNHPFTDDNTMNNFTGNMNQPFPDDNATNNLIGNMNHPITDDTLNNFTGSNMNLLLAQSSLQNPGNWNLSLKTGLGFSQLGIPSRNNLETRNQTEPDFGNEGPNNADVANAAGLTLQEPLQYSLIPQSGLGLSQLGIPSRNNLETRNQTEQNFGNEGSNNAHVANPAGLALQEPLQYSLIPQSGLGFYQSGTPSMNNPGTRNQTEQNFVNEGSNNAHVPNPAGLSLQEPLQYSVIPQSGLGFFQSRTPSRNNLETRNQTEQNFGNEGSNNAHVATPAGLALQEPLQCSLIPQPGEKRQEPIDFGQYGELGEVFTSKKSRSDAGYSESAPSQIQGERSNPGERNLVTENVNNPPSIPTRQELPTVQEPVLYQRNLVTENVNNPSSIPTRQELPTVQEPVLYHSPIPPLTEQQAVVPLPRATNWEVIGNQPIVVNSPAASLRFRAETSSRGGTSLGAQRLDNDRGKLPVLPREPPPPDCSACDMLREIIHLQAGGLVKKLQLHGAISSREFYHALCYVFDDKNSLLFYEKIDFFDKGFGVVENFLSRYLMKREREGCIMQDDERALFFKILWMGGEVLNTSNLSAAQQVIATAHDEAANRNNHGYQIPILRNNNGNRDPIPQEGNDADNPPNEAENQHNGRRKRSLSEQRHRIRALRWEDFTPHFTLSRGNAAQAMEMSETVLHNKFFALATEKHKRWPFRELMGFKRELQRCQNVLDNPNSSRAERNRARNRIPVLEGKIADLYIP